MKSWIFLHIFLFTTTLLHAQEATKPSPKKGSFTANIYLKRGILYRKTGEFQKAIKSYNKAIELSPKLSEAYYQRGMVYDVLRKDQRAMEDYNKAIELNPKSPHIYNNRGIKHNKLGQYHQAIKDYDKAIELDPNDSWFYSNRAVSYQDLKQYQKAIEDYSKAIELSPFAQAYKNRGNLHRILRNYKKAERDYLKAIKRHPHSGSYYYELGLTYFNMNQPYHSVRTYLEGIMNDKNTFEAMKNISIVEIFKEILLKIDNCDQDKNPPNQPCN